MGTRNLLLALILAFSGCGEGPSPPSRPEAGPGPGDTAAAEQALIPEPCAPDPPWKPDTTAAIELLRTGGEDKRSGAVQTLLLDPGGAVPRLLELLGDDDAQVRIRALDALISLADWWAYRADAQLVVRRAAARLHRGGPEERSSILTLLEQLGPHRELAVEALGERLGVADREELQRTANLIARIGAPAESLRPSLLTILLDRSGDGSKADEEALWAVTGALADLGPGDGRDVAVLARRLGASGSPERSRILYVLESWGEASAPALDSIAALVNDADAEVGRIALAALGRVPGGELLAMRTVVERAAAGASDSLRFGVAFDDLGPRFVEALPWLIETAKQGPTSLRVAAIRALGGAPSALHDRTLPVLRRAFRDEDDQVRVAAAWVLFWREEPLAEEEELLGAALRDRNAEIRRVAVMTIGRRAEGSADPRAAARIAPFLTDPDPDVRFRAGNELLDIGLSPAEAVPAVRENLLSPERLVRLGSLRAAIALGPDAAPAVPELFVVMRDPDLGSFAVRALAGTGVLDDGVRRALRALLAERPRAALEVMRSFGFRASFLLPEVKAILLEKRWSDLLVLAAGATDEPEEMAAWIRTHADGYWPAHRLPAFEALGVPGLPAYLELAAGGGDWITFARRHVRSLGASAVEPLVKIGLTGSPGGAALAVELLGEVPTHVRADAVARLLDGNDAQVRAAAGKTAARILRAGAEPAGLVPHLVARLTDDDAVRAAALHALAAAGTAPGEAARLARAALSASDPDVRVAAAAAVHALTGDAAAALPPLREVFARPPPSWGWIGGGGTPARTEDEYEDMEKTWAAAARTLGRMGSAGAPAAEDLLWAALRHGEPRMQRILVDAVAAMGPSAAFAAPLLLRIGETHSRWLGHHETVGEIEEAVKRAKHALGIE